MDYQDLQRKLHQIDFEDLLTRRDTIPKASNYRQPADKPIHRVLERYMQHEAGITDSEPQSALSDLEDRFDDEEEFEQAVELMRNYFKDEVREHIDPIDGIKNTLKNF